MLAAEELRNVTGQPLPRSSLKAGLYPVKLGSFRPVSHPVSQLDSIQCRYCGCATRATPRKLSTQDTPARQKLSAAGACLEKPLQRDLKGGGAASAQRHMCAFIAPPGDEPALCAASPAS